VEILRDHGYVDSRGMGVCIKIIPLMRQYNQVDPIFEATEDYVKTILPRGKIEGCLSSGRSSRSI
ncbi:hypothetical protein LJC41_09100, partial [Desulfosarcina sp. OttesenSCG-928-G17]|nr:hypothetical protein [Desulfosarcina sp. OttesenSCG-928-G17]